MSAQLAFIFVGPEVDSRKHCSLFEFSDVKLHVVGVASYKEGVRVAKDLVNQGVTGIELCAGFGHEGVAQIVKAVEGKAVVGVVRFDLHPGFSNVSGDKLFNTMS